MPPPRDDLGRRRVPLPGGGVLTVRPVTPADVDGLAALYDGLSGDDRYRRFFSSYRPPRSFFERLASAVERGGYGVVATVGADGNAADATVRLVGEASYELLPNGDGELGIAVAADQRGWLGPYLLDALVEAAAVRGVPNLEADVLVTNRPMLTLLRSRGYATVDCKDFAALRLMVGTTGRTPVWPRGGDTAGPDDRPRVLVEVPGGRWHAGTEAEAAGLQVIACSGPRGVRSRCPVLAGRPCPLAAGADAIVVSNAPDHQQWRRIVGGHASLHPGVPVCVEPRRRPVRGQPRQLAPEGSGAVTVGNGGPRELVEIVDRLARLRRRARHRPAGPPEGDLRP